MHDQIAQATSTAHATQLANAPELKPLRRVDWHVVRDRVMRQGMQALFAQHPQAAAALKATGDRPFLYKTATDPYWGDGGDGRGLNKLSALLQRCRALLQECRFATAPVTTPCDAASRAGTDSAGSRDPVAFYEKGEPFYELTNFFKAPILVEGLWYATSENYFQAQKYGCWKART